MENTTLLEMINVAVENEEIIEFESEEEALDYFIRYDYQNFKTVEDMKQYQDEYGFGLNGKWYHINYEEVLEELKENGYTEWLTRKEK